MPQSRRQYEKARKALRTTVAAALKRQARAGGWSFAQGRLFQERAGWLLDVRGGPRLNEDRTAVDFRAKPMALDPVFCEIVRTPDNVREPLSFRLFGAWTCQGPAWSETQIAEDGEPEGIAERILAWANAQSANPPVPFDLNALAEFIKHQPEARGLTGAWLAELITLLALAGRLEEARDLCVAAIDKNEQGGYSVGAMSFPELALAWITERRRQAN